MRLACLRCKSKKVKCDKGNPTCHQCITARAECVYVERRPRPRLAQQRVAVNSLNKRLELLERRIVNDGYRSGSDSHRSTSAFIPATAPDSSKNDANASPASSIGIQVSEHGKDSWIYQMASDTQRRFQTQATPAGTPTPQIDTDMSALNNALEDLGKLRLRAEITEGKASLTISPIEAKQCLEAFFMMMDTLVIPGIFASAMDLDLLRSLPDIISSPYVRLDPGIHVIYYAALHYGLHQTRDPGHAMTQAAYLKLLEHVPAWLESATETDMDGYTAALSAWIAVNNLDYQLSWRFHLKACYNLKSKGIDVMDVTPAHTFEEEAKREPTRYLYWHVLSTDCLYRLFLGRPTTLKWTPQNVRPPSIMTPQNMYPRPIQVMLSCVWTNYTAKAACLIDWIDNVSHQDQSCSVTTKTDECCKELEALIADWKMEALLTDTAVTFTTRCLVADHIMNIHALIVGLKRVANRIDRKNGIDAMTLRSARKVVHTLLDFEREGNGEVRNKEGPSTCFVHFILFYPFCAIFTLYEHIIATPDTSLAEPDLQQLEQVAAAMEHSSRTIRVELIPFAKTIKALNKVARTVQDGRRKSVSSGQSTRPCGSLDSGSPDSAAQQARTQDAAVAVVVPDLDLSAFSDTWPDFPMTLDGDPDPLGFVRALENDFVGRNWNGELWD